MTDPDAAGGGGEYQVVVGESLHVLPLRPCNPSATDPGAYPPSLRPLPILAIARAKLTTRIRMDKRRCSLPSR